MPLNTRHGEFNVSWDEIRNDLRREGMSTTVGLQQVLLQGTLRHILDQRKNGYYVPEEEKELNETSSAREVSNKLAGNSIDRVVRRLIKSEQEQEIMARRSSNATSTTMSKSSSSASLSSILSSHKSGGARARAASIESASCGVLPRKASIGPLASCISISLPSKPSNAGLPRSSSIGSSTSRSAVPRSTSIGSVSDIFSRKHVVTGGNDSKSNSTWLDTSIHDMNDSMNSSHHKNIYTEIDEMENSFSSLSTSRSNKISSMIERASNNLYKELREEDEVF
mmetsp:Transcript_4683/g.6653  ORF Transcript_4683/g.6653 Transcript_4683/m.6653 type:complete len:281 (+) Transcript_4683:203-1045(+)